MSTISINCRWQGLWNSILDYNSVPGGCVEKLFYISLDFHVFVAKQYLASRGGMAEGQAQPVVASNVQLKVFPW